MQSKTSFFNRTIFWKTVSRFWPLWCAYFVLALLGLPIVLLAARYTLIHDPVQARETVLSIAEYGGCAASAVFAVFSAMAVWSFLYSARSASGIACLPVRREALFTSAALAGLLPLLCANLAAFLLAFLAELSIGCAHFGSIAQGFAIASLQLVLFYGFATLCAQLTGNILILPAVYTVLNFVAVVVEMLVRYVLSLFVYGLATTFDTPTLRWFSPVVGIVTGCSVHRPWLRQPDGSSGLADWVRFTGWRLLLVYAAVGVLLLVCALLLFRRRRMESAGDVVAVRVLKPIFRWCMALGCALCFGCLINVIFFNRFYSASGADQMRMLLTMLLAMLIGSFIGWFAAEMLMKKTFRVFRSRFAGWCVCCLVIAALLCAAEFDLFGYERRVPDAGRVERVTVNVAGETASLERPENIARVCALHESVIAHKAQHERGVRGIYGTADVRNPRVLRCSLRYALRSGRMLTREYDLYYAEGDPATYGDAALLQDVINCQEAIDDRKALRVPVSADTVIHAEVTATLTAAECAALAGYDSAEEYILRGLYGFSRAEIEAMSEEERRAQVDEMIRNTMKYPVSDGRTPAAERAVVPYTWTLDPAEAAELYDECILPDIADGTLGRLWVIHDDDYRGTVYDAGIYIELRVKRAEGTAIEAPDSTMPYAEDERGNLYDYFQTTPTVDSVRTNAWLAAHGVTLHTLAETENESIDGYLKEY
jgi:ABC-2 type transport system permease protein